MGKNCDLRLISASCLSAQVKEKVFGDTFLTFFHRFFLSSVAMQIFAEALQ
jgi:hypothetical protein